MNNTPNYPYLSGYLQSQLKDLAWDEKFVKMSVKERYNHILDLIKEANKSAIEYANEVGN